MVLLLFFTLNAVHIIKSLPQLILSGISLSTWDLSVIITPLARARGVIFTDRSLVDKTDTPLKLVW